MLTQMSIKLTQWTKHKKQIASLDRKASTYYFGLVIEVCLCHWFPLLWEDTPIDFPKPQQIEGRKEKKIVVEQST
jgi:hypothetical protein